MVEALTSNESLREEEKRLRSGEAGWSGPSKSGGDGPDESGEDSAKN